MTDGANQPAGYRRQLAAIPRPERPERPERTGHAHG